MRTLSFLIGFVVCCWSGYAQVTVTDTILVSPTCHDGSDGSIEVIANGSGSLSYSIDEGLNWGSASVFTGLSSGDYAVWIGGTDTVRLELTLTAPERMEVDVKIIHATCTGDNGTLVVSASNGLEPYEYSKNNGIAYQSNTIFSALTGGDYIVRVRDANGCSVPQVAKVLADQGPTVDSTVVVDPTCTALQSGSFEIFVTGNGEITYRMDSTVDFQEEALFEGLQPGTYYAQIQDGDGCVTLIPTITLLEPKEVEARFVAYPEYGYFPLDVVFENESEGAESYEWLIEGQADQATEDIQVTFSDSGSYEVALVAHTQGCSDTTFFDVVVYGRSQLTVPNVFTPNGDQINDRFEVQAVGITDFTATIFNRWGEKVHEWTGTDGWWDGHTFPAGNPCASGIYYYVIKATGLDGETFEKTGSVTLYR